MAQAYEIEEYVNPEAWDDPARAQQAIEEIAACGTDDGDVWAAIVRRVDGETVDSLGRALTLARQEVEEATGHLRGMVILAVGEGVSESEAARRAQVDRMTVRRWLGKR